MANARRDETTSKSFGNTLVAFLFGIIATAFAGTAAYAQNAATYGGGTQYNGASVQAGTSLYVTVYMYNSGYTTWSASTNYKLGSQGPTDNVYWGKNRVLLTSDVPPGQYGNFTFYVTVPTSPGWYNMQWQMLKEGCCWFGDVTPAMSIYVYADQAQYVSQNVPTRMYPGSSYPVSLTIKNTGNTTWTAAGGYHLGSQDTQDNTTWGFSRVNLPNDVAPGDSATFNFVVTAPTASGSYGFQWQMVHDGFNWFGDISPQTIVNDSINSSQFVSQNAPSTMQPAHTYPVTVVMKNTGTSTWRSYSNYKLGFQNPPDSGVWTTGRVVLTSDVLPGANATINLNVTSPSTPGTYNLQWRMMEEGYEWFGAASTNQAIPVNYLGPIATLSFSSYDFNDPNHPNNGALGYGNPSNPIPLYITNSGDQVLQIQSITSSGTDFYIYPGTTCTTVQPGANCVLNFQFIPTAIGLRTGYLSIVSNASPSPQYVALSGVAVDPSYPSTTLAGGSYGSPTKRQEASTVIGANINSDNGQRPITAQPEPWKLQDGITGLLFDAPDGPVQHITVIGCCRAGGIGGGAGGGGFGIPLMPNDAREREPEWSPDCISPSKSSSSQNEPVFAEIDELLGVIRQPASDIGFSVAESESVFVLDPINAGTGNKYHSQLDYQTLGDAPISFERSYNNQSSRASAWVRQPMGPGWIANWDRGVYRPDQYAYVTSGDGKSYRFAYDSQAKGWVADPGIQSTLTAFMDAAGNTTGWQYTTKDGDVDTFDAQGKLITALVNNRLFSLAYDASGRLASVTNRYGQNIKFSYDASGRLSSLTDAVGRLISYTYDDHGRLATAKYQDSTTRQYRYEDSKNAYALTSILDETGQVYASFTYDYYNRATGSAFAGGVGSGTVSYGTGISSSNTTTPDGTVWTRNFSLSADGTAQLTSLAPSCPGCALYTANFGYDSNGLLNSYTDATGTTSTAGYDTVRGLPTSLFEPTPSGNRVTYVTWHPTLRKPTTVSVVGGTTTTYQYDGAGSVTQVSVSDGSTTRTATYTYDSMERLTKIDGAEPGTADVTSFTYDGAGNVSSTTNALNQTTSYGYDAEGHQTSASFPDGTSATMTYDLRGRMTSASVGGRTRSLTYYPTGQIASDTDTYGVKTTYTYDSAQRLTEVDRLGEKVRYTLDSSGRRTRIDVYDASGTNVYNSSYGYDALGRLITVTDALGKTITYSYTNMNLTGITTPVVGPTQIGYDSFGRVTDVYTTAGGHLKKSYDDKSRLATVTDPVGAQTTYSYNQYDDSLSTTSADAGTTSREFGASHQVTAVTDGRPVREVRSFDLLGRLTSVTYPDHSSIAITYDGPASHIGKVSSETTPSLSQSFDYDPSGRLASISTAYAGLSKTVTYTNNGFGDVAAVTYPSGNVVTYVYTHGRITQIQLNGQTVVSDVQYFPFGNAESWLFGHGSEYTRFSDGNRRITGYLLPQAQRQLTYDDAGRITKIDELVGGAVTRSQVLTYDGGHRIVSFSGFTSAAPSESQSFTYDANGNRASITTNGTQLTYSYLTSSNRITTIAESGNVLQQFVYDGAGRITNDGLRSLTYGMQGQASTVTSGATTVSYSYNLEGQRIGKTVAGVAQLFLYDPQGNLLGEYGSNGAIREYIWLGSTPVAVYGPMPDGTTGLGYIWTDHLNTPRLVTTEVASGQGYAMQSLWTWDSLPFGETAPNANPAGLGNFQLNLRFSGQYAEAETGLVQNRYRDYSPQYGRFMQADPGGLQAGTNVYVYAGSNPISIVDPLGLYQCDVTAAQMVVDNYFRNNPDLDLNHAVDVANGAGLADLPPPPDAPPGTFTAGTISQTSPHQITLNQIWFGGPVGEGGLVLDTMVHEYLHQQLSMSDTGDHPIINGEIRLAHQIAGLLNDQFQQARNQVCALCSSPGF